GFTVPDVNRKFTELYNVQHLDGNRIDDVSRVTISTIQRLFSTLRGDTELAEEIDEHSAADAAPAAPVRVEYNPAVPPETFDVIDRAVIAQDQIRTVLETFRDRLFTEIFPGRSDVPKTLIFAKDDSHADDIVQIAREVFSKGDDFIAKITYKATGRRADELIKAFRNSPNPRIAVTVDMIATGTDVKPLECVFFMRMVKSRSFFEQMRGRGVRVVTPTDLRGVTPDATVKDRFVLVDAVGVTETELIDTVPLDRKPTVPLERLLRQVSFGIRDPETASAIAARLSRLDRR